MGAPGVTFETVDLNRPRIAQLRTDICGFVGYTERGPIDRPVKVQSWRQFLDAFGPALPYAHTGNSLRLYFSNGGDTAYMMRVVDPTAAVVAAVDVAGSVTLSASYAAIDRARTQAVGPTALPAPVASPSPGSWGNRLAARVIAGGMGTTQTLSNQPGDGASVRVEKIAGFNIGSWIRLVQDGRAAATYHRVQALDPALREIVWSQPIAPLGLDLSRPVRLETVEFSLVLSLDGQETSRHLDLSLDPDHPRFVEAVMARESTSVSATSTVDPVLLDDPTRWPTADFPLRFLGGRDGLATVTRTHLVEALDELAEVDEISVLAAPDLVLIAEPEFAPLAPLLPDEPCKLAEPLPRGVLEGLVVDAESGAPIVGARISSSDVLIRAVLSDATGQFVLTGLPLGQVRVRVEKSGFTSLDATAQSFGVPSSAGQRFELAPRVSPPVFTDDEIFDVQSAMIAQGAAGLYRVALLDPPLTMLEVEDLQGWRSRFDTSHAALYWPWLITAIPGTDARAIPASGAVAGLIARTDRAEGPQRAPANLPLRDIQALSHSVDDATHALLNDLGINVVRATPGRGIAPQGARTLSSDPEWRYLGVRRLVLMISEAIEESHQWAVFEPNNATLRNAITHSLNAFLGALWSRGAFAGVTREASFIVKCDAENNPPEVIDAGQLIADIAIAPVRPYEFIRLRLGRTDRVQVQE